MGRESHLKEQKIRRKNAKLYPIYKMFSWDLLCFYSIQFLFLTITKGISVSDVLFIDAIYLVCKCLCQVPSVAICDFLGRKKSMVLGNLLVAIYIAIFIIAPNKIFIIISNVFCAFGFVIKNLSESNLLYDSVATKGGDGLYAKIDGKGGSLYYILDGTAALVAGYLFVINNYLPVLICFACTVISTILSCGFKDVYNIKKEKKKSTIVTFKEYGKDLKDTFKFIFQSKRLRAFIFFKVAFYSTIRVIDTYRSDLLLDIGISQEQFSMIFAMFTFIAALAVSSRETIEKKFKNRTLSFISLTYMFAVLAIGLITLNLQNKFIVPIVLIMLVILKVATSIWFVLEGKYLKNFTTERSRSKITFTFEFITCLSAAVSTIFAGKIIQVVTIEQAFLIIGLIGLAAIVLSLDYMRTRFGLKPNEYAKKDIEFSK